MSEISRLFDEFFSAPFFGSAGAAVLQRFPIDVIKHDTGYRVIAELPGVTESETSVEATRDALVIKVDKTVTESSKNETEDRPKEVHLIRERRTFNVYERKLALPKDVDLDKVEATFENGLLTIELPVREAEKPREIKVAVKAKEIEA